MSGWWLLAVVHELGLREAADRGHDQDAGMGPMPRQPPWSVMPGRLRWSVVLGWVGGGRLGRRPAVLPQGLCSRGVERGEYAPYQRFRQYRGLDRFRLRPARIAGRTPRQRRSAAVFCHSVDSQGAVTA